MVMIGLVVPDVIYDFGMNNGDDVEYYLKKGMKVVGVEANPSLCQDCGERFGSEIESGRLVVLNVALSARSSPDPLTFYVHRTNHVLSQVGEPEPAQRHEFDAIKVSQRRASDIIREYGKPHYVKIDVEHMDQIVLRDLFTSGIFPDFLSSEAHSIEVFALLVAYGYSAFKLVDGPLVSEQYRQAKIATPQGYVTHAFKRHSAGPYGEDIASSWRDPDSFFLVLASEGLGWKDIHATRLSRPDLNAPPVRLKLTFKEHARDIVPSLARSVRRRIQRRIRSAQLESPPHSQSAMAE